MRAGDERIEISVVTVGAAIAKDVHCKMRFHVVCCRQQSASWREHYLPEVCCEQKSQVMRYPD